MFRDVSECSGMFRNVPGCSMFRILSTPILSSILTPLKITFEIFRTKKFIKAIENIRFQIYLRFI